MNIRFSGMKMGGPQRIERTRGPWLMRGRQLLVVVVTAVMLTIAEAPVTAADGWSPVADQPLAVTPNGSAIPQSDIMWLDARGLDRALRFVHDMDPVQPSWMSLWNGSEWSPFFAVGGDAQYEANVAVSISESGDEIFVIRDNDVYRVTPDRQVTVLVEQPENPNRYWHEVVLPATAGTPSVVLGVHGICTSPYIPYRLTFGEVSGSTIIGRRVLESFPCNATPGHPGGTAKTRGVRLANGDVLVTVSVDGRNMVGTMDRAGNWSGLHDFVIPDEYDYAYNVAWHLEAKGNQAFVVGVGNPAILDGTRTYSVRPLGGFGYVGPEVIIERALTLQQCAGGATVSHFVWRQDAGIKGISWGPDGWSGISTLAAPSDPELTTYQNLRCAGNDDHELITWQRRRSIGPPAGPKLPGVTYGCVGENCPEENQGYSGQVLAIMRDGSEWTQPIAVSPVSRFTAVCEINCRTSFPYRAWIAPDGASARVDMLWIEHTDDFSDDTVEHFYTTKWSGGSWESAYPIVDIPPDLDDNPPDGKTTTTLTVVRKRISHRQVLVKARLEPALGRTVRGKVKTRGRPATVRLIKAGPGQTSTIRLKARIKRPLRPTGIVLSVKSTTGATAAKVRTRVKPRPKTRTH